MSRVRLLAPLSLLLGGCIALCEARNAFAYRPFVSTDAAVAAPGEVEVELGYAGFRQDGSRTAIVAPTVVGNFGVARNLELVAEFKFVGDLSQSQVNSETGLEDNALSLKWVAQDGVLQEDGHRPSLALEMSLLLPTTHGQHGAGGEVAAIESDRIRGWTYHLNAGALVDPGEAGPGAIWGVILEHPLTDSLRAVGGITFSFPMDGRADG